MKRLMVVIGLALAVLAAMLLGIGLAARARALAEADRTLEVRAQFFADQIDRVLQQRMVQTFTFAALPSLRGFAASDETNRAARAAIAVNELQAIAAADPNVRAVAILDATGKVILANTAALMNTTWSERAFVRDALAGKIAASVPAREFSDVSQFYAAPILNNAGEVAGVLVVRVTVQELWSTFGVQSDVLLVDENGVRVADRSVPPQVFTALTPLNATIAASLLAEKKYGADISQIGATNLPALRAALASESAHVVLRDARNQTLRAATHRLKTNAWTVIAWASEDAALSPVREIIAGQILVALVTALVVTAALWLAWRTFAPNGPRA